MFTQNSPSSDHLKQYRRTSEGNNADIEEEHHGCMYFVYSCDTV